MKKQSDRLGYLIYFGAIGLLVVGSSVFLLEKTQVTNFYQKPITSDSDGIRPVNDIDYSPASPTDNQETDQKKQDGTLDQPSIVIASDPIGVTLTAATQDTPGGPVVVRVLITNATGGTCYIALTNGSKTVTYTKQIINSGTYYSCEPLDIPANDLSVGNWQLTVAAKNSTSSGTARQDIEVALQ